MIDVLLEFRTTNYKSFKDEMVFSMIPAPKQKGLDYSILHKMAGKKEYKGLCSAVIYGLMHLGKRISLVQWRQSKTLF